MTWKTRFVSLGHKMTSYDDRELLALPLMRHLRLILLILVIGICILILRLPYLIEQISQQVLGAKDLVASYTTGDYIREFDHLRVGILEQFDQELRIVDADIFLDDRHDFKDETSLTVRDHLKQEQNRLRQHLSNYVRLQSFEEKDLTMAMQDLDEVHQDLAKLISEALFWIIFFLAIILLISRIVLQDLRVLFFNNEDGTGGTGTTTSSSLRELSRSALIPMPMDKAAFTEGKSEPLAAGDSDRLNNEPEVAPEDSRKLTEQLSGTLEVEIFHQHETYKFFTVNYSETGLLLSGLELRPQIFATGEELNGTLKSGEKLIYFKGKVVRVQQERQCFLYGIRFLSTAVAPERLN